VEGELAVEWWRGGEISGGERVSGRVVERWLGGEMECRRDGDCVWAEWW
jgi:hypothetical protein